MDIGLTDIGDYLGEYKVCAYHTQLLSTWGTLDLIMISFFAAIGAIFAATDSVCTLQVLNQDDTPLLYSLVFGEGVVNDATSVVLFNAIQNFDLVHIDGTIALQFFGNFLYLFLASTVLGVAVSSSSSINTVETRVLFSSNLTYFLFVSDWFVKRFCHQKIVLRQVG